MKLKILSQSVSNGESLRYGEQHRGVARDLRSELQSIGYMPEMGDFIRLELRYDQIVLAVGRTIVGRGGDYIAAWLEIPKSSVYASAQSLPEWIKALRATNDVSDAWELNRRCQELESQALPQDEVKAEFRASSGETCGYILYRNEEELSHILSNPIQAPYSGCRSIYILEETPQSGNLGANRFELKDIHESVVLAPPSAEARSKGQVERVSIVSDNAGAFDRPKRYPKGHQIRLRWKHSLSFYQPYEHDFVCGQPLELPTEDKWEWSFPEDALSVSLRGGKQLAKEEYRLTVDGKSPEEHYTRQDLLRGLKLKVVYDKYRPIEKTITEKELQASNGWVGWLEFKDWHLAWSDIQTKDKGDKSRIAEIFVNGHGPLSQDNRPIYVSDSYVTLTVLLRDGTYRKLPNVPLTSTRPIVLDLKLQKAPTAQTPRQSQPSSGTNEVEPTTNEQTDWKQHWKQHWKNLKQHWEKYLIGALCGGLIVVAITIVAAVQVFGLETILGKKDSEKTEKSSTTTQQTETSPEQQPQPTLTELLGQGSWYKSELDKLVPDLYDALNKGKFGAALELIGEELPEDDELMKLLKECSKKEVEMNGNFDSSGSIGRSNYIDKLKKLLKEKEKKNQQSASSNPVAQTSTAAPKQNGKSTNKPGSEKSNQNGKSSNKSGSEKSNNKEAKADKEGNKL